MQRQVLIVDDDAAVRESIRRVLEVAGYRVVSSPDGEAAISRFAPEQIDLVLLDLNLPFRNGWEVFERLTTRYPIVPIIVITGMPNQYRTALAAGVGALMEKPIEVAALLLTMQDLLAEPAETRLARLCGRRTDTRYLHPAQPLATARLAGPGTPAGPRLRLAYAHRRQRSRSAPS